jgi:succinate dehydrogenase hydrophobic anchor subunit
MTLGNVLIVRCSSRVGGAALSKKHDYVVLIGLTAIILALFVIGGITFTYMTRPALVEAAAKRVLDIQMFEENFR